MTGCPLWPERWRGGLPRKAGRNRAFPFLQPQIKSSMRSRGWGEPWVWDLTFSWFLTLPLLILGHSSWMLSPCPLFHKPPPPSVAHVGCGEGRYRESLGGGPPQPRAPGTLQPKIPAPWVCECLGTSQGPSLLPGLPEPFKPGGPQLLASQLCCVCAGSQREGSLTPVPPLIPSLLLSAGGFIIRICTVYCV